MNPETDICSFQLMKDILDPLKYKGMSVEQKKEFFIQLIDKAPPRNIRMVFYNNPQKVRDFLKIYPSDKLKKSPIGKELSGIRVTEGGINSILIDRIRLDEDITSIKSSDVLGFQDKNDMTALMTALRLRRPSTAKLLLSTSESNPWARSTDGLTALMIAVEGGDFKTVNLLLATQNPKPGSQDAFGETALMWACRYCFFEIVAILLATGRSNPRARSFKGKTALSLAAKYCDLEIIQLLLGNLGSDPRDQMNKKGRTALMIAVRRNKLEMVRVLLATHNSNPKARDNNGKTALMMAVPGSPVYNLIRTHRD